MNPYVCGCPTQRTVLLDGEPVGTEPIIEAWDHEHFPVCRQHGARAYGWRTVPPDQPPVSSSRATEERRLARLAAA